MSDPGFPDVFPIAGRRYEQKLRHSIPFFPQPAASGIFPLRAEIVDAPQGRMQLSESGREGAASPRFAFRRGKGRRID